MSALTRRAFIKNSAFAAASLPLASSLLRAQPAASSALPPAVPVSAPVAPGGASLRWLDGAPPAVQPGAAWGVPWPRGEVKAGEPFALRTAAGAAVPVQTWPLATWPDGSLKWTGHAIPAGAATGRDGEAQTLTLLAGAAPAAPAQPVAVTESADAVEVSTGVITCRIPRRGGVLVATILRDGREIARAGRLVALRQADAPDADAAAAVAVEAFAGEVTSLAIEQDGPVRAVVRLEGSHRNEAGRAWLPFVVRLYFHASGETVRMVHTFIYDGDEHRDFIRGLGIRFDVPLRDAPHDRHVRFTGEGAGLWAEAVRGVTGLRRDPGKEVRAAQVAGLATPPLSAWDKRVSSRLDLIPAWGDYTLSQLSADGFGIRKRTKPGHAWIQAASGRRASGLAYLGGPSGGFAFGQRYFWQRYPVQIDIRGAAQEAGEAAEVTNWLWSPEAPAMDLRFYHDGLGMDTHEKEREGLEITYEDYEKGFGTPHGIARTSELFFHALEATPPRGRFPELAAALVQPGVIAAAPAHLRAAGVFGDWSLPDRSAPEKARLEDQLDHLFALYARQVEQRRWYGFWDHGDVMHTYDRDRHEWRYDVGGYAWDNSELSPDLWLWYTFLRSGRADVFRLAEAMTRHTGEVDVYHLGRFRGLGTRHNVQHWGCSAKQLRISTAVYRRFYYYLTADERTGDLLHELVDADEAFLTLDPLRKIRKEPIPPPARSAVSVGFGTDWGSLAAAWLTEWERTGDTRARDKLLAGMRTIAAQPTGFLAGGGSFNLDTGEFAVETEARISVSHLNAVFGLAEICSELVSLVDVPAFREAWLRYCRLYNASADEQRAALGRDLGRLNLRESHARLTAWAARSTADPDLAARAWQEFYSGRSGLGVHDDLHPRAIVGPAVLNPVEESFGLGTNATAQWGLAAIQCLALVGDRMPAGVEPAPTDAPG
ncbi:hypothetical protein OPIT5_20720 [Opitutaceae bacterium TAV5]|nr:hypothetical protein OPIT5_20720 [Opitutaceae bacterium TAV5]